MKDDTKKRINKLVLPLTKRTLSILSAATIMTTGLSACKSEMKDNTSDISTKITNSSEEGTLVNDNNETIDSSEEVEVDNNSEIVNSDEKTSSTIKSGNNTTSSSKNSSSGNAGSKKANDNTNSSKNNSGSTNSSNNTSTSSTQQTANSTSSSISQSVMPSTLTSSNINDVEVLDGFVRKVFTDNSANIVTVSYWYNNQLYKANDNDYKFFMCLLNREYVNADTYAAAIEYRSLDDFYRLGEAADGFIQVTKNQPFYLNFDKIVINANKRNFLKQLQTTIKSGDQQNLKSLIEAYFTGENQYMNYGNDIVIDYFMEGVATLILEPDDSFAHVYIYYYNDVDRNYKNYIKNSIYENVKGKQIVKQ